MTPENDIRTKLDIMTELLGLTNKMLAKQADADILTEGIASRQVLMDEYDSIKSERVSDADAQEIKRIAKDILQKDRILSASLTTLQAEAKRNLVDINSQQKAAMNYNKNVAAAGSYMDFKK